MFEHTLTTSSVYAREVIMFILQCDAAAVIFVHNHTSGTLTHSKDYFSITKRLKAACKNIDLHVHDHLIIGGNDYYSFAQKGKL